MTLNTMGFRVWWVVVQVWGVWGMVHTHYIYK